MVILNNKSPFVELMKTFSTSEKSESNNCDEDFVIGDGGR